MEQQYPPVLSAEIVRRLCGLGVEVVGPLAYLPDDDEPQGITRLVGQRWDVGALLRYVWGEN